MSPSRASCVAIQSPQVSDSVQVFVYIPEARVIAPVDNRIYVPQAGFPSIDAFVVSENKTRVTMLQITVSTKHGLKPTGIRKVIDALIKGGLPRDESRVPSLSHLTSADSTSSIDCKINSRA
jgi:hypothetical protein